MSHKLHSPPIYEGLNEQELIELVDFLPKLVPEVQSLLMHGNPGITKEVVLALSKVSRSTVSGTYLILCAP